MLRPILLFVIVLLSVVAASGQAAGQSPAEVRRARGEPMMVRKSAEGETWVYADGRKIEFRDGVVANTPKISRRGLERDEEHADREPVVTTPTQTASTVGRNLRAGHSSSTGSRKWAGASIGDLPGHLQAIFIAGAAVCVFAKLWFIVLTFREGMWWGLGNLFVPLVGLVFLCKFWYEAKGPFLTMLVSLGAMFALGVGLGL